MRAMFSCTASYGHFRPLVPLARAFVAAGHEVVFATSASFARHVEAAGFDVLPAGMSDAEAIARFAPYRAELQKLPPGERRPLSFMWRFATIEAPAKLDELRSAVEVWKPDLMVHESADLAAPLVAALNGLRAVHHGFGRLVPAACFERAAEVTASLWHARGLDPGPLGGVFRSTYLDICPPSFQSGAVPPGVRVVAMRPTYPADAHDALPASIERLPSRPTVYVTLGTVYNELTVFRLILDALADIDCNVVATIGRNNDPRELDPLPATAVVERYLAQSLLLPRCAVTIGHGGSGSVLAALAQALPMLLLPQGADQFENAQQLAGLGAARLLMPGELTAVSVRTATVALLVDDEARDHARALAGEIAAMPSPTEVVPLLVQAH